MTYQRVRGISLALLCVALLACAQQATALSYELCDSYGAEWVTDSPRLTGKYPFYSLLFFCNGGLNIEGKQVDSCLRNGTACGQPAADAFCKYIGFDGAVKDLFETMPATEPTRAVSGEWCVNEGVYQSVGALNRTDFDALINSTSSNGSRCTRLYQATCYRSRDALGKAFSGVQADAATAPASGPQQIGQKASIQLAAHAGAPASATPAGTDATAVGGRKLKGLTLRA